MYQRDGRKQGQKENWFCCAASCQLSLLQAPWAIARRRRRKSCWDHPCSISMQKAIIHFSKFNLFRFNTGLSWTKRAAFWTDAAQKKVRRQKRAKFSFGSWWRNVASLPPLFRCVWYIIAQQWCWRYRMAKGTKCETVLLGWGWRGGSYQEATSHRSSS